MTFLYKLTEFKKTCDACPSQWEGKLDDGRLVYVRYRWGHGKIEIGEGKDIIEMLQAGTTKPIFEWSGNDAFDGYISETDLKEMVTEAGILDFSSIRANEHI